MQQMEETVLPQTQVWKAGGQLQGRKKLQMQQAREIAADQKTAPAWGLQSLPARVRGRPAQLSVNQTTDAVPGPRRQEEQQSLAPKTTRRKELGEGPGPD